LLLVTVLGVIGCGQVSTTRVPLRGRLPGVGLLWEKPISASARADLQVRRLRLDFAAHPRDVFRKLEAETQARPTPDGFLTLGEIAYRVGQRTAVIASRESLEWYRDAAVYASFVVADLALGPEAIALHNRAVTQCLRTARGKIHPDADHLRDRLAEAGIVLETANPDLDISLFNRIDVAGDYAVTGLTRHTVDGLGVPLLAVRELPERDLRTGQDRFYGKRLVPPITALILPEGSPTSGDWRSRPIRLVTFDPIANKNVAVGGQNVPLAADFTTPLAYLGENMAKSALAFAGAINPEKLAEKTGIYQLHPYRPGKIPVLLIHGLASSPDTWIPMLNELRGDPVLRERYQFWCAYYPTGYPSPVSVARLRKELHELQQTIDPQGTDPALRNMVVVGHSMGGLVSRLMVQSSGDAVWNAFFTRPRDQIVMTPEIREWAESVLYFQPEPTVRRMVFIATPHRGSNMANKWIGRISSKLVRPSPRIHEYRESLTQANGPEIFQPTYRDRMLNSIDNLEWESPMLKTLNSLPMAPGMPYHSIVGNITRRENLDRVTDGVVNYESAHFEGSQSELMIPYFHTRCTAKPEPIEEVRRILLLHLGQ
jgi:pimeloyl-ACP methyl ester carboxylesterase